MANVGLPGTSGFIGEFLSLIGAFQVNVLATIFATFGIVLSASYGLWLCRSMIFGVINNQKLLVISDLSSREKFVFAPLIIATLFLGIVPMPVLDFMSNSVEHLVSDLLVVVNE